MNLFNRVVIVCLTASRVGFVGCSKPRPDGMPPLVKCAVTLKYSNGKPAEGVTVVLSPVASGLEKCPSAGKTDSSGKVQIVTYGQYQGAPEGEYKVVLNKVEIVGESNSEDGSTGQTEPIEYYSLVGVDFTSAETTPLSLKVGKKSVSETFDVGEEARELIDRFVPGKSL